MREALAASGRSDDLLAAAGTRRSSPVDVDKLQLARALVNLFDNADRHGGGVTAVDVRRSGGADPHVQVVVDDAGPGVAAARAGADLRAVRARRLARLAARAPGSA